MLEREGDADDRKEAAGRCNHVADAEPEARQDEPDDVAQVAEAAGADVSASRYEVAIHGAPAEFSLYSFAYTVAAEAVGATFVIAGAADADVTQSPAGIRIVRDGETGDDAMAEKAAYVMARMDERLRALGLAWADVTRTNVYTVHGLRAYLSETILAPLEAAAIHGIHWHLAHPPIAGLAFEMDVRGVCREHWLRP